MASVAVGTDVVDVDRVRRLVARGQERFLTRWFTVAEVDYCVARADPARHLAGRLAAKESVAKALGHGWDGPLPWREIEVTQVRSRPGIVLHGRTRALAAGLELTVSIAYTATVATAVVVAWPEQSER